MIEPRTNEERLATIEERTKSILYDIKEIKHDMDNRYVSKEEFEPIKMLVYGLVGMIMSSVIMGLILLLVNSPKS
jgi:hypothetical protein